MVTTRLVAVALAWAASTLSASGQSAAPTHELTGTSWTLVRFAGGDDTVLTPEPSTPYTLTFERGGRAAVRFDCNRGRTTWSAPGTSQLTFGPLMLTRAMCPEPSLHDRLVKMWPYVRSYVQRDGHLFLSLMADGGILEFAPVASAGGEGDARQAPAPARPGEDAGPEGTWRATRVGELPVAADARAPRLVLEAGRLRGSDGCNRLRGTYRLDGERLTFGPAVATQMACPGMDEVPRALGQALHASRQWRLTSAGELEWLDASGAVVARFAPAAPEAP